MSATHRLLRFGVFELNLDTEELRKLGTIIKLRPQPFRLLAMLASHSGQIVTRDEIQQQLWGQDAYVDFEHGVNRCIKQIREALGDDTEKPIYVETLPRHGYRFLVPVTAKTIEGPRPAVVQSDSGEAGHAAVLAAAVASAGMQEYAARSSATAFPELHEVTAPEREQQPKAAQPRLPVWRRRAVWVVCAMAVAAVVGATLYWRTRQPKKLTEKDTIVIADFDNSTGDAVLNGTLRQALSVDLEQSPFLNILSDQRIAQIMRFMGYPKGESLRPELAREVCVRTGSAATLEGAIAQLGKDYVVSLKVVRCDTNRQVVAQQFTVDEPEKILPALGNAASRIRSDVGESLISVKKYDVPLEDVTTSSLPALHAYTLGRKMLYAKGESAALPFFQNAVELDPNFARPYVSMSIVYANLNEAARAAENAKLAFRLRDKVSERERFAIDANYYLGATGELDKAAQTYEHWRELYPREPGPHANLAFIYGTLGNWKSALDEDLVLLQLEADDGTNYANLGFAYACLNRFSDAEGVYRQAFDRKFEGEYLFLNYYQLAFVVGDSAKMNDLVSKASGKPGVAEMLVASQANTAAWFGKLRTARDLTQRAADSASEKDAKETAAFYKASAALREAESGNFALGEGYVKEALNLASNRDVQSMAALTLARIGNRVKAENMVSELDNRFPLDTVVQQYWLPTIRAAIILKLGDPHRALSLLQTPRAIELGDPTGQNVALCPVYLRGETYLQLHDAKAAAVEFQKFIDYRGVLGNFPLGALARLGLARAYAMQGDTPKARTAYEDFLTLWKDADPDIPVYQQAKAEYAKLVGDTATQSEHKNR